MREPAVSGSFYPSDRNELDSMVSGFLKGAGLSVSNIGDAVSYVAPHAGYQYSGSVAGYTYKALSLNKQLQKVDTFVFVGPNHTGEGSRISLSKESWSTPMGVVESDTEFVDEFLAMSVGSAENEDGHLNEHSLEVQLPFLQKIVKRPKCCFICMLDQTEDASRAVAHDIETVRKRLKRNILVIASSDLNHYESENIAMKKDMPILDKLSKLDVKNFYYELNNNLDSACGFAPMAVAALYAKQRGAKEGKLLKYATSGDVTGDKSSVVAYGSMAFI